MYRNTTPQVSFYHKTEALSVRALSSGLHSYCMGTGLARRQLPVSVPSFTFSLHPPITLTFQSSSSFCFPQPDTEKLFSQGSPLEFELLSTLCNCASLGGPCGQHPQIREVQNNQGIVPSTPFPPHCRTLLSWSHNQALGDT